MGKYEETYDDEAEEDCDLECGHVADNAVGSVHRSEDLVILDLFVRGILVQFEDEEWIEFKQLMWEAIKNDKR